MKLFKYEIMLKRITADDIELVRRWRNSDCVSKHMHFRGIISKEQQKRWFRSIDNINNFYYLIYYKEEPIGLYNDKNINWDERTSETGLFIWDDRYIDTHIPLMASLILSEMGFYIFEGKKSYVSVMESNKKSRDYTLNFGYKLCSGEEGKELQKYELTREQFEIKGERLIKAMNRLFPGKSVLHMLLEPDDYKNGIAQHLENILNNVPFKVQRKEDEHGVWYSYGKSFV
jgi:hypothetical protein